MKSFNSLSEMKNTHPSIIQYQESVEKELKMSFPDIDLSDYNTTLGGKVNIVETLDEWLSILEKVPCVEGVYMFDDLRETFDKLYIIVFIATNDAGGPLYYVPKQIYSQEGIICK
jgi:hypothetical protein